MALLKSEGANGPISYLEISLLTQCFISAAVNRIKQIIANGMRPKGPRAPGVLPMRPPGPPVSMGTISFDQPPPLMSLNTNPSPVRCQVMIFASEFQKLKYLHN